MAGMHADILCLWELSTVVSLPIAEVYSDKEAADV